MSDMNAISQNLMHTNISITDGIYGGLSEMNVKAQITSLGTENISFTQDNFHELMQLNKELIRKIESNIN
jgi:hypothetical protein